MMLCGKKGYFCENVLYAYQNASIMKIFFDNIMSFTNNIAIYLNERIGDIYMLKFKK